MRVGVDLRVEQQAQQRRVAGVVVVLQGEQQLGAGLGGGAAGALAVVRVRGLLICEALGVRARAQLGEPVTGRLEHGAASPGPREMTR